MEIRAASVVVVDRIRDWLRGTGRGVSSVEVDWFLWEHGEGMLKEMGRHHRTLTIYY